MINPCQYRILHSSTVILRNIFWLEPLISESSCKAENTPVNADILANYKLFCLSDVIKTAPNVFRSVDYILIIANWTTNV